MKITNRNIKKYNIISFIIKYFYLIQIVVGLLTWICCIYFFSDTVYAVGPETEKPVIKRKIIIQMENGRNVRCIVEPMQFDGIKAVPKDPVIGPDHNFAWRPCQNCKEIFTEALIKKYNANKRPNPTDVPSLIEQYKYFLNNIFPSPLLSSGTRSTIPAQFKFLSNSEILYLFSTKNMPQIPMMYIDDFNYYKQLDDFENNKNLGTNFNIINYHSKMVEHIMQTISATNTSDIRIIKKIIMTELIKYPQFMSILPYDVNYLRNPYHVHQRMIEICYTTGHLNLVSTAQANKEFAEYMFHIATNISLLSSSKLNLTNPLLTLDTPLYDSIYAKYYTGSI